MALLGASHARCDCGRVEEMVVKCWGAWKAGEWEFAVELGVQAEGKKLGFWARLLLLLCLGCVHANG